MRVAKRIEVQYRVVGERIKCQTCHHPIKDGETVSMHLLQYDYEGRWYARHHDCSRHDWHSYRREPFRLMRNTGEVHRLNGDGGFTLVDDPDLAADVALRSRIISKEEAFKAARDCHYPSIHWEKALEICNLCRSDPVFFEKRLAEERETQRRLNEASVEDDVEMLFERRVRTVRGDGTVNDTDDGYLYRLDKSVRVELYNPNEYIPVTMPDSGERWHSPLPVADWQKTRETRVKEWLKNQFL